MPSVGEASFVCYKLLHNSRCYNRAKVPSEKSSLVNLNYLEKVVQSIWKKKKTTQNTPNCLWESTRNVSVSFVCDVRQSGTCLPETRVQVGVMHQAGLLIWQDNFSINR